MFVGLAINTAHELAQLIPLELLELNEVSIPFPKKKEKETRLRQLSEHKVNKFYNLH